MRELLIDLHRTDGMMQATNLNYNNEKEQSAYYESVLQKHGVTQAQFDSSLVWYTDNPNIFDKIYPAVVERLEKELEIAKEDNRDANAKTKRLKTVLHQLDSIMQIPKQPFPQMQWYDYHDTTTVEIPYRLETEVGSW